jgi:hypothetical protein
MHVWHAPVRRLSVKTARIRLLYGPNNKQIGF